MRNNTSGRLGYKLTQLLDIPVDMLVDWPKLVLSGNKNVMIQNHRGIIEYDESQARINTKFGELKITGSGLRLTAALKEEISIEGKIEGIQLNDWR